MWCGMRWTQRRRRARRWQGGSSTEPVSNQPARGRAAHVADGEVVWFWHPLLVSSPRRFCGPNRASSKAINPRDDGDKRNSSPGRARRKPLKPLRREGRIASAEPVCSCAFFVHLAHETAGAACTRSSLRPLSSEAQDCSNTRARLAPREREIASTPSPAPRFRARHCRSQDRISRRNARNWARRRPSSRTAADNDSRSC
jgi:hypothetical protein